MVNMYKKCDTMYVFYKLLLVFSEVLIQGTM